MKLTGQHIKTNNWIFFLMVFAFFWLVIGDLIVLHQKVIYGFDPFSIETPFAKSDNTPSKSKTDKGAKFEKFKDQYHFDVLLTKEFTITPNLNRNKIDFNSKSTVFLDSTKHPLISLRAPPAL